MTLKFSFFYKHSNKDYFLGLLQKVANAHSVEIRAEIRGELLCIFASAGNAEILGTFADTLESEIPLSLYFRLKSVELYEKPLSAEKVAQNLENIFSISEINAIKNPSDSRFCDIFGDSMNCATISSLRGRIADSHEAIHESKMDCHDSPNAKSCNDEFMRLDSPTSLKNALTNLCDLLSQGQSITLSTSKGAISLSTKSDDFDFILANDISTISLYTRASADELNALASFEKPLLSLNIKEVFARDVGAKTALFILPYDIILCCISSILLNREIAFVYGKKIDSVNLNLVYDSTHTSDFFEIIVGQNGYFLSKNFLDLSANLNGKKLSNLWDFLDFNFDNFKGESIKSNSTPHSPSLRGDLSPKQSTQNSDIFIAYLSTKNPTHLANLRTKAQIVKIAFDKNPKNILQKITTLENGGKLIANFKKEFEARFRAIQSLDSTPQMSENIMDIFECAAMILGQKRDKNAIFDLANHYLRDIGPKIDFKNVSNSSLGMQFRTCENFGDFADSKSSLNSPKRSFLENSHKYKSHTANTRIVDSSIVDSNESNKSSLRGRIVDSHEAIQKNNNVDCHDSATPILAMMGGGMDCHESLRDSRNDGMNIDCFGDESPRNDESMHDSPKLPQDEFALFYDESRTIRSIISFTLAGSEPEVIAFGIIESLVDYLILIFRDAQKQFETKNMGIIGDIFANKIFFDKITQKIPKDFNLVFPKFLDIQ